jgi:hypothetical protein
MLSNGEGVGFERMSGGGGSRCGRTCLSLHSS